MMAKVQIPIVVGYSGRMSGNVVRSPHGTHHEDIALCEEDIVLSDSTDPYTTVFIEVDIDIEALFRERRLQGRVVEPENDKTEIE